MQDGLYPSTERRRTHSTGLLRRTLFEESLALLRALGFSSYAVEYYRRIARNTHRLPHESVRDVAEEAVIMRARSRRSALAVRPNCPCRPSRGRMRG
jgi:hypothetical protein